MTPNNTIGRFPSSCLRAAQTLQCRVTGAGGHTRESAWPYTPSMIDPMSVTKTTYAVVDFLEWQRQGSLDLQPFYQRRSVWNPRVKSLLIDSLLRGYPVPLIFLHNRLDVRTSQTIRQVVDGQQRLRTILAYVDIDCIDDADDWDRFTVLRSHNREYAGLSFQQLDDGVQRLILQTPLSVNVLPADVDDVTVLTIFQRMNSTGFKLNDQEIRNATFFGEFKEAAYEVSYAQHQRWLSWGIFSRQDIAQMKEVELASDLLGLLLRGVGARTKAGINSLYRTYDETFSERARVVNQFNSTFDALDEVYGAESSRSGLRRFRSTGWFYSVFALMSGADAVDLDGALRHKAADKGTLNPTPREVVEALERTEKVLRQEDLDDELLKVLRGATADRSSRSFRIAFLREQL